MPQSRQTQGFTITSLLIRESIVPLAFRVLFLQIITAALLYLINLTIVFLQEANLVSQTLPVLSVVYGLIIISSLIMAVYALYAWRNHRYVITKNGIKHRSGVLSYSEYDYSCTNIETIELEQDFWGKVFHFGTIKLYDPALQNQFYLADIGQPKKNMDLLKRMFLKSPPTVSAPSKQIIIQHEQHEGIDSGKEH